MPTLPITGYLSIGLALVAAIFFGLWQYERAAYEGCQASIATAAAAAEKRVNDAKSADAKLTNALAQQAQTIKDTITEQMNATNDALRKVASNPACAHDAASDAFDRSLRTPGPNPGPRNP